MSSDTAADVFRKATPQQSSSSYGTGTPQTAQDVFASQVDALALHPLAAAQSGELDYLLLDDAKMNDLVGTQGVLPSRGWGDELCYGTGTTYLSGLAAGGLWGLREGLKRPLGPARRTPIGSITPTTAPTATPAPTAAANPILKTAQDAAQAASKASSTLQSGPAAAFKSPGFRLRLATVLNSVTRRGTFVGNNAGVLALIYNMFNCTLDKYRGMHDIYGSMASGFCTGLVWRSTAGLRPMLVASSLMTVGAAGWTTAKQYIV